MSSPKGDGNWRRQAALFAAAASGVTGLGILVILIFVWRDAHSGKLTPTPAPAASPAR